MRCKNKKVSTSFVVRTKKQLLAASLCHSLVRHTIVEL